MEKVEEAIQKVSERRQEKLAGLASRSGLPVRNLKVADVRLQWDAGFEEGNNTEATLPVWTRKEEAQIVRQLKAQFQTVGEALDFVHTVTRRWNVIKDAALGFMTPVPQMPKPALIASSKVFAEIKSYLITGEVTSQAKRGAWRTEAEKEVYYGALGDGLSHEAALVKVERHRASTAHRQQRKQIEADKEQAILEIENKKRRAADDLKTATRNAERKAASVQPVAQTGVREIGEAEIIVPEIKAWSEDDD